MFFVELKQGNNNQNIYEVRQLFDYIVKFEPLYLERKIP